MEVRCSLICMANMSGVHQMLPMGNKFGNMTGKKLMLEILYILFPCIVWARQLNLLIRSGLLSTLEFINFAVEVVDLRLDTWMNKVADIVTEP